MDFVYYTYSTSNWGDLLTNYDGTVITYDSIGNPTKWRNSSNLTWDGRTLTSQTLSNGNSITYKYNSDGIRTQKRVFDDVASAYITHDYVLDGSKILSETVTDAAYGNSYTLYYIYDANGSITGLHYNGAPYYFQKSIQGDVLRICDASGNVVVEYTYDAWGNILSVTGSMASTLGQYNSFRYRGYYYDSETGLYYLNSRYYDAEVGRFINADSYVSTGQDITGHNMFAYCGNNPVNREDPTGQFWITALIVTAIVVVSTVVLSSCSTPEPYSNNANCYAYAMKLENDPRTGKPFKNKPQPGEFSGNKLTRLDLYGDPETVKSNINKRVLADAEVLNLNYTEVDSANHVAKPGNWVVALAYATDGTDYHWYRRNDDGTWSHKPGSSSITSKDASGHAITDPATCNRGIYDGFLGYYEVGPN